MIIDHLLQKKNNFKDNFKMFTIFINSLENLKWPTLINFIKFLSPPDKLQFSLQFDYNPIV